MHNYGGAQGYTGYNYGAVPNVRHSAYRYGYERGCANPAPSYSQPVLVGDSVGTGFALILVLFILLVVILATVVKAI
ncbi:YjcZ family sporulation protein [Cytobacillus sp. IB215665]|uniref:YjcZ family sporulation protein n=1 Tax=Cytobacillus sp. IB215665 TaxID=3097357 RepID=UPI002A0EC049|nr:YjcZ family sporulation protein [Cytobacillus sp. IB215665]MDX8366772.1 YjcZ family sporulation protein [Cytobacillus sp. IB215665]